MAPPDPAALRERLAGLLTDRFEIGPLLGQGGYAAVFRARDLMLERDVAIKVFEVTEGMALDQCLSEARLVATIEHPHIVPLYEVGCEAGLVYLVMRLFPEGSLGHRLHSGSPLTPAEVVALGMTVADALATAHARGVVHLDIKPDNILLDTSGRAAVTDFGIAQALGSGGTSDGQVSSGTPHYMSPEHVAGDVLDGRSDVYALGVVLYEAASGRPAVGGNSATEVMANQVRQVPPSLDRLVPDFPTALAKVVDRALAKDPAERWESAAAFGDALRALAGSEQLRSPAELARRIRRRWLQRSALGCGFIGVGLALALWGGVAVWRMINGGPYPAVDAFGTAISPMLLDSAVTLGLAAEGDTVQYLFIPASQGMTDALVVTSTQLVRLQQGRVAQWNLQADDDYRFDLTNKNGYFIIHSADGTRHDTLYHTLRGRELRALRDGVTRVVQSPRN